MIGEDTKENVSGYYATSLFRIIDSLRGQVGNLSSRYGQSKDRLFLVVNQKVVKSLRVLRAFCVVASKTLCCDLGLNRYHSRAVFKYISPESDINSARRHNVRWLLKFSYWCSELLQPLFLKHSRRWRIFALYIYVRAYIIL